MSCFIILKHFLEFDIMTRDIYFECGLNVFLLHNCLQIKYFQFQGLAAEKFGNWSENNYLQADGATV